MLARFTPVIPELTRQPHLGLDELFREASALLTPPTDRPINGQWLRSPTIPADVSETENELRISLDLPGHDPDALQVRLEGNTLMVQSERRADPTQGAFWRERLTGSFSRSFELPMWVDASRVEARYQHGVLHLTLPRRDDAKPRTVQVKVER